MSSLVEYERMVKPIKFINQCLAIWPIEKENITGFDIKLRAIHRLFVFLLIAVNAVAVTCEFVHYRKNIEEATECALIGTAFYLSVLRIVIYTIHLDNLTYIVKTMKGDWENPDIIYQEVLKDKCLFVFKMSKYFIVMVLFTICVFILVPILESVLLGVDERKLPFRGYFYENQTETPVYQCLYVYSVIVGGFGGFTISGATSLNLVIVMHGSAKFKIVRTKFEALKTEGDNSEEFAECVKQHHDALFFAERVEETINILALGQFVISTGLLCFAGIQLTATEEINSTTIKYSSFLNSAIFELFLFSYSGQELITESEEIGISIYASGWIGSDYMKSIRIIMMRSLRPSSITAGKFYDMSLMSFSSVLSTAFSYFTVLRSVNTSE